MNSERERVRGLDPEKDIELLKAVAEYLAAEAEYEAILRIISRRPCVQEILDGHFNGTEERQEKAEKHLEEVPTSRFQVPSGCVSNDIRLWNPFSSHEHVTSPGVSLCQISDLRSRFTDVSSFSHSRLFRW